MRRKRKPPPPIPLTKEDEAAFRRCFQRPRKQRVLPDNHGVGRFALGDKVTWKGSTRNMERTGVIVEVVGIGQYPTVTEAPDEPPIITYPELNVAHYYREPAGERRLKAVRSTYVLGRNSYNLEIPMKKTWTKQKPTKPGAYYVRNYNLGNEKMEALVEVRRVKRELCSNLHNCNSDADAELFPLADHSDQFEWSGPLAA